MGKGRWGNGRGENEPFFMLTVVHEYVCSKSLNIGTVVLLLSAYSSYTPSHSSHYSHAAEYISAAGHVLSLRFRTADTANILVR